MGRTQRVDNAIYTVKYKGKLYQAQYIEKYDWFEIAAINASVIEKFLEVMPDMQPITNKRKSRPFIKRFNTWATCIVIVALCLIYTRFVIIPLHQKELWTWDNFHPLSLSPDSLNGFICGTIIYWIFYKLVLKRKK